MKVMLRKEAGGQLMAYVAKKDLEEKVVSHQTTPEGDLLVLENGWRLLAPSMAGVGLPKTVEAQRLED